MAKIENIVENLIHEKILELGYELYDVEYVKEGKDYFLRVYIDNSSGITLDDCELVSNNITDILDAEDYIKDQYFLEVSSPGIERILKKDKHLESNIGNQVQIKLFNSMNGSKTYIGILKQFNSEIILISTQENEDEKIERKNIAQIKTIYNW